jgi:hypothetical protein
MDLGVNQEEAIMDGVAILAAVNSDLGPAVLFVIVAVMMIDCSVRKCLMSWWKNMWSFH